MPIAKSKPLKLQSPDQGDLKRLSSTEENYLAYQVGSHLIENDSDVGNITHVASGNTSIGSYINTFFNEAIGTHPASSITSGSTTTTVYQVAGTADETDSDFRKPIGYYNPPTDGSTNLGGEGIYEMADSDMNVLVDRLNGRIAQSDYLGQFKLGSSAPDGNYALFRSNIFKDTITDTNGDETDNVIYNIYRRETQSAPTNLQDSDSNTTFLASIRRANGDSGDFEGIRPMTARQQKVSLGQRAKTRRAISGGVGSYALRSSSQGAPATGSWRAVGTATDTKKSTSDVAYTRTRISAYSRTRVSNSTRNSTRTSTRDFVGDYIGDFTGNFVGDFTNSFIGNRSSNFAGNYLGDFTGNYSRTRVSNFNRTRVSNFIGNYIGNRTSNYVGNYSRDFIGNRASNFAGDYVGNYSRDITSTRTSAYQRTSTRVTRTSTYEGTYTGDFTGNYAGDFVGDFTGNYARDITDSYTGNYTGDFAGNFLGNYERTRTSSYSRTRASAYTRTSTRTSTRNVAYARTTGYAADTGSDDTWIVTYPDTSSPQYTGEEYSNLDVTFNGVAVYAASEDVIDYFGVINNTSVTVGGFVYSRGTLESTSYGGFNDPYITKRYRVSRAPQSYTGTGTFAGDFVGNYSRDFVGNYSRNFTRDRLSTSTRTSTRNFVGVYSRQRPSTYTRNSTRTSTRTSTRNSTSDFAGNYSRNFSTNYVGNYARQFSSTRTSTYNRTSTRTRASTFSRTRTSAYARTSTQDFTRTSTRTRASNYVGNYSRDFVGVYTRNSTAISSRTRVSTFARTRNSNYTQDFFRNSTSTSVRTRSSNYVGDFTGDYSRNFVGNYSRNFIGNYLGTTIGSGSQTIETYTLYVRYA